jgi:hypothetical protein
MEPEKEVVEVEVEVEGSISEADQVQRLMVERMY